MAVFYGNIKAVQLLLRAGAHSDVYGLKGRSPLQILLGSSHLGVTKTLPKAGANANHIIQGFFLPLQHAARHRHAEIMAALIAAGVFVDLESSTGLAP
ncbi:MAG: hypothetical protein GOMPHAMPRED_004712 [Gomphillus americanus]|uniref:Uncharacterized protein n=1 Tax=Gomphillus americanus TaxID=1940652 RepID=A0A8H3EJM3_9LECA|nr:MAG: hypothetical protein GOMPHAMPRED_004712 [Gomphillus americanus]